MKPQALSRRCFLRHVSLAFAPLCISWEPHAASQATLKALQFGVCADPHKDVMHDADQRLRTFIATARQRHADFIVQLGGFCRPYERNREFLRVWESFTGARYHTLGNHDRDGGFTWQQVLDFWGLKRRYYSFDQRGWHFVVLDGNEKKPGKAAVGYLRFIGAEQTAWLEEDLAHTSAPRLVLSHQSLENAEGLENGPEMRAILERANAAAGWRKVGACLSGHHHIDCCRQINGIHYLQINSMSYSWLGDQYAHVRYSDRVDKAFPSIKYTAPYKDALFALVKLEPEGRMLIEGIHSEFVGASPWELGVPEKSGTDHAKDRLVPEISNRTLVLAV